MLNLQVNLPIREGRCLSAMATSSGFFIRFSSETDEGWLHLTTVYAAGAVGLVEGYLADRHPRHRSVGLRITLGLVPNSDELTEVSVRWGDDLIKWAYLTDEELKHIFVDALKQYFPI